MLKKEVIDNVITAIKQGRADVVRSLIALTKNDDNSAADEEFGTSAFINNLVTEEGTLLHLATELNQTDIVRLLLLAGADPGVQNNYQQNAVELAKTSQMQTVYVDELLKATAEANTGRICQLIAAGVNVNCIDNPKSGNTALHWAATYANKDVVKCLLDRGANINAVNACGVTPLHDAVHGSNLEMINELMMNGADPYIKASKGKFANKTPLDLAASSQNIIEEMASYKNGDVESDGELVSNSANSLESLTSGSRDTTCRLSLSSSVTKDELNDESQNDSLSSLASTDSKLSLIWPRPQVIVQREQSKFVVKDLIHVYIISGSDSNVHDLLSIWETAQTKLEKNGYKFNFEGLLLKTDHDNENWLTIHINRKLFRSLHSYKLVISSKKISIVASDRNGLHNSLATLLQLFRLFIEDQTIPQLTINDWPSTPYRGALVDMTANRRVLTLESILNFVEIISHLKMNHLYFYTEFNEKTTGLLYSSRDVTKLEHFCYQNCMQLIPSIDVKHEDIFHLAEFVAFLHEYLSHFSNISFLLLGPKITSFLYLESLLNDVNTVFHLPKSITIIFCIDEVNLTLQQSLPENSLLFNCNSQMSYDFKNSCQTAHQMGVSFGILTPISTCESLTGLPDTTNIINFNAAQFTDQAITYLNGDWNEFAFPLPAVFSWPSLVVAAAVAWNSTTQLDDPKTFISDILNLHVFQDESNRIGNVLLNLGRSEWQFQETCRGIEAIKETRTLLLQLILTPDDANLEYLTIEMFAKMIRSTKRSHNDLTLINSKSHLLGLWRDEVQIIIDLMHFTCRLGRSLVSIGQNPNKTGVAVINLGIANLLPTTRTDLANKLLGLIEQYKIIWTKRNLETGLERAIKPLNDLLGKLIPNRSSISQI